jgi:hypothetical protein
MGWFIFWGSIGVGQQFIDEEEYIYPALNDDGYGEQST